MMSDTTVTEIKPKSAAENKAIATNMLSEIRLLEEQMDRDHADSERLKAETMVIKAHISTTLSQLQRQIDTLSRAL